MHAAGKMKRSPSPPVVERPGSEPLAPVDGRKGAAGLVWAMEGAEPRVGQNHVKKQLRVGSWAGSAQGPFPSALPGSITMRGTFSHRPDALSCHPQRGRPASTGHRDSHFRAKARRWPAVMTPRRAALRANDVGASHRAADGADPSIPGARTHAHGTSMGAAAAVSCIWSAFALKRRRLTRPSATTATIAGGSALSYCIAMEDMYLSISACALCPFAWSSGESARKKSPWRGFDSRSLRGS